MSWRVSIVRSDMATELDLPLFRAERADPNVVWLERLLDTMGTWMTARQIATASAGRLDDRQIRVLASATTSVISGQRGYRHIDHATLEEADRASTWLVSQGREMIRRGIALRREGHRRLG
jgi:hypothetical protein